MPKPWTPPHLRKPRLGIESTLSQQVIMRTRFHNPAQIHDVDHIGTPSNGEAVGNHNGRPAIRQDAEPIEPVGLSPRIKSAGRLVAR